MMYSAPSQVGAPLVSPRDVALELQQVMSHVRPDDLSAAEISALLAILAPAHARVIGGAGNRLGLRVLRTSGEDAAPKPT
jgi:hypothetical protein